MGDDRPPVQLTVLLERLAEAEVRFVVVGGLAAVAQGAPWTTSDLDIVHDTSAENVRRLHALLSTLRARHRRPDRRVVAPSVAELRAGGHVLLDTELGPLDVLCHIEGGRAFDDLLPLCVELPFRGHTVHVLGLRALVEIKRTSPHPKDARMVPILEEALRQLEDGPDEE